MCQNEYLYAYIIASFRSFSGSIIHSDLKRMLFLIMVISSKMGPSFCRSLDAVLGIHVFPELIIPRSLHSTRFSAVNFIINDIPYWSITGVVCSTYSKLCSSSASICSFSGKVENGFPCLNR